MSITKRLSTWALLIAAVQMIPLVGNWPWTGSDYVFASVMLFGSALVFELIARKSNMLVYRAAVGIAVFAGLALIWVNGAVGMIGSEDNPANLMYLGVLAVGFLGAIISRLEPRRMARTMFVAAFAQALVPVIALLINSPFQDGPEDVGTVAVITLNFFWVMMWVASGLLFRQASDK